MRIYLAGKVTKHGWRESIVGDSLNAPGVSSDEYNFQEMIRCGAEDMIGGHDYCGPFLIACDHACGHMGQNHGVVFQCWAEGENKKIVFETCKQGIDACDAVYCWIGYDFSSAYGTIWELGYAHALGKPVYVGISKDIGLNGQLCQGSNSRHSLMDFWFPLSSVKQIGLFDTAFDGFNAFFSAEKGDSRF